MIRPSLQDHPGWQWCTAEGAELHSLLMGLHTSLAEKIQWLEEAENLTLAMRAMRASRNQPPQADAPLLTPDPSISVSASLLFSVSAFQRFSVSAFQRFSVSAFQRFSVSAFQHLCFYLAASAAASAPPRSPPRSRPLR
jgi:hypothetical protein